MIKYLLPAFYSVLFVELFVSVVKVIGGNA